MECNLIKMMKKQLSFIEVKMILIPFCLQMFEWILFYIGTTEIHGLSQKKSTMHHPTLSLWHSKKRTENGRKYLHLVPVQTSSFSRAQVNCN